MSNDVILKPIEEIDGPVLDEILDLIENMSTNQNQSCDTDLQN